MGNNASTQEKNLEEVQIYPKTDLSNHVLINYHSSRKDHSRLRNLVNSVSTSVTSNDPTNYLLNDLSNESSRTVSNYSSNRSLKNEFDNTPQLIETELNQREPKRRLFYFKKKKKFYKNNQLIKSKQLIANELVEKSSNKHIQVGNGLVSLKNLNYYLASNDEFNLVNRIIKRIGVFNQQTQTENFEPFDDECMKLIEVSHNLVEQLENLVSKNLISKEIEEQNQSNEGFNMVYCGTNHKKNKRNVCIQRCLSKTTQGTQTVESIAHLIIIQILNKLNRLNVIDEQIKLMNCESNELNELNASEKYEKEHFYSNEGSNRKFDDDKLVDKFSDLIDNFKKNEYFNRLDNKEDEENSNKFLKRKSVTLIFRDEWINELNRINRKKFNSQPILNDQQHRMNPKTRHSFTMELDDPNENASNYFLDCKKESNNLIDLKENFNNVENSEEKKNLNDFLNSKIHMTGQLESMNKENLEEYLKNLLIEVHLTQENQKKVKSRNACVQTMNDLITDELPEYAARCPSLRKKELIYSSTLFDEIDKRALEASKFLKLDDLVNHLTGGCENDIFKVRAMFRWITHNMSFDWNYLEEQHKKMVNAVNDLKPNQEDQEVDEINNNVIKEEDEEAYLKDECLQNECLQNEQNQLQTRIESIYRTKMGSSKEFVELFIEMCKKCEIRCKLIQGFAKNYDYRPGHLFLEEDIKNLTNVHYWTAVFVLGNWHLIDLAWSTGFTDPVGKFQRQLNEFYFFTDPEQIIWTHFPFNQFERDYDRWQLLDKSISLEKFNNLPKITPNFFEFNLKLRSKISNPVTFKVQTEIKISSHEPIRYKYKLFHVDELENCALNNFVFCQLKSERLVVSFVVCPPLEGRYYFKVYARTEKEMQDQNPANASLHYVVCLLLECTKARKYQMPYPLNELPYGPVQSFYDFKMQLVNQNSAIISSFGGKRKLTLRCHEPMMITYQIIDADGQEQDIRAMVIRDDENSTNVITLTILPPRVGLFKLSLFGSPRPKPNQRGKTRLPLLSTFLIDCRLAKIITKDPDPQPLPAELIDNLDN